MKQKNVWLVISIIFAIAVIIGGLYFATDLFKSPEQLFYKHIMASANLFGDESYEDVMKEVQRQSDAVVEVAGEITAKITSDDEDLKEVADVLNKGKISYNYKTVGAEKKLQSDITLNYNQKDIVTLNLRRNKEQYGVKIAEAYDKYVSVENNNLKALFTKLGVDATNIPNRIETLDYKEFLNIDKETLNHIKETYSKIITENIPSECYTIEKNTEVEVEGTTFTTNAYKLNLTQTELVNVLTKVYETLKNDDVTLNLIINKYNMIMEPYKMMGASISEAEITKADLVETLQEKIEALTAANASEKETFEIVVYSTKDGRTKIVIKAKNGDEDIMTYEIDALNINNRKTMIVKLTAEDTQIEFSIIGEDKKAELSITIESEGTTVNVALTEEVKATDNVVVEDFTTENSVKLNDMTQQEMNVLAQTIYTNVMKALPQKMELLGISTTGPTLPSI